MKQFNFSIIKTPSKQLLFDEVTDILYGLNDIREQLVLCQSQFGLDQIVRVFLADETMKIMKLNYDRKKQEIRYEDQVIRFAVFQAGKKYKPRLVMADEKHSK